MIADLLHLPFPLGFDLLQAMPPALGYLLLGLIIMGWISAAGFVLARLGYRPLWAFALVVPFVQTIVLWLFAYSRWPREKQQ